MRASADLATEQQELPGGRTRTVVTTLRCRAPLSLRLTMAEDRDPWTGDAPDVARVCLAASAAGPVGGDRLALDVDVGAHSTLVVREVSTTVLLPGPDGARSRTRTTVRVRPHATLVWLPEPVVAAAGCHHLADVRIDLEAGARLLLREELLLGPV